jgi:hypothetical protein
MYNLTLRDRLVVKGSTDTVTYSGSCMPLGNPGLQFTIRCCLLVLRAAYPSAASKTVHLMLHVFVCLTELKGKILGNTKWISTVHCNTAQQTNSSSCRRFDASPKRAEGIPEHTMTFRVMTTFRFVGAYNRSSATHGPPSRWSRSTLYLQNLTLTSLTSGGCSVGIVRSQTQAMECFVCNVHW